MVVLDSDILTLILRQAAATNPLAQKLSRVPEQELSTTIANFEEQMRGWLAAIKSAGNLKEELDAYRLMNRHLKLYARLEVLDFDARAATRYQELRKRYRRLGASDLKIAAITLTH